MKDWLLLIYKVPREPTSSRVYVWRKLKQLGALLLHDSVWVLPASDRTQEQFQWLAAEIVELQGEATLARAEFASLKQQRETISRFQEQVDMIFKKILKDLKKKTRDLSALSRRFQQAQDLDFFQSQFANRTREALLAARGDQQP